MTRPDGWDLYRHFNFAPRPVFRTFNVNGRRRSFFPVGVLRGSSFAVIRVRAFDLEPMAFDTGLEPPLGTLWY